MSGGEIYSSTLTDSSSSNLNIINYAQITNTQNKFGGTSAYFNGINNYLQINSTEVLNLTGATDYTIEFWMWLQAYSNFYTTVLTRRSAISWQYLLGFSNPATRNFYFSAVTGPQSELMSTTEIPLQQWTHIAATVSGGIARLFINGIKEAQQSWNTQPDNGSNLFIGQQASNGEWFNGYIDELRITKGVARYTTDYFPLPTEPFPDNSPADPYFSSVVLLLHMYQDLVTFNNNSTMNGGTIHNPLTIFNKASHLNEGTITGKANFQDSSYNSASGIVNGSETYTNRTLYPIPRGINGSSILGVI